MSSPRVSVITAVYDPPRDAFEATVASVLAQTNEDWEWILTDDRSPSDWVVPRLRELAAQEPRVRVRVREENGGIVAASNDSLAEASGEFVALLDHDDVLERQALERMLQAIDGTREPDEVDYVYSDQDWMTADGRCHRPFRKPDWSPERLRHHMYTTHFSMLRRSLVLDVGGFRAGFDGSQDHDLVLRVTEQARQIVHVREVLYHWRQIPGSAAADPHAKPYAWDAGVRAVQDHLDRVGIEAVALHGLAPGFYQIDRTPDLTTPVSVIIPTIGSQATVWGSRRTLVVQAVSSLLEKTQHENLEFVVVYDTPTPPTVIHELRSIPGARLRFVEFTEEFNFSAKCNVGALHASGDVFVFLNDDMEAESDGLIETLITPLNEPGVGATGAKLLFEDGRIQHAGVIYGDGQIGHHYYRSHRKRGSYCELAMNREVSALTGACLAMRRETFQEVGGFTEKLPGNFNDVDMCLKIRAQGHRLIWMHDAVLHHFESATREASIKPFELRHMTRRWGDHESVRDAYTSS
ncbi:MULTISPECIES: glycosyltransferase family 2 protein [Nocardioides]|uniref:Glycosyltransferase n=1 Tax=Nocardioides vastitatis TaxID=2568655 RepID=A0ABW0ZFV8_9ACTN|nr:glycosyltransferase [Nocardioides sp.]